MREDDVIDLRNVKKNRNDGAVDFLVERMENAESPIEEPVLETFNQKFIEENAGDKVRVKFDKFVALVDSKVDDDVVERYMNEDIIVSTSLLTDLASASDAQIESGGGKYAIFVAGAILGIVISFFVFNGSGL